MWSVNCKFYTDSPERWKDPGQTSEKPINSTANYRKFRQKTVKHRSLNVNWEKMILTFSWSHKLKIKEFKFIFQKNFRTYNFSFVIVLKKMEFLKQKHKQTSHLLGRNTSQEHKPDLLINAAFHSNLFR